MNRFGTRVAIAFYALALSVSLLLGTVLITTSLEMMRNQVIESGSGFARLLGTGLIQKKELLDRLGRRPRGPRARPDAAGPDLILPQDMHPRRPSGPAGPGRSDPAPPGVDELQNDLKKLAEAMQAIQVALVFEENDVVNAVTKADRKDLLSRDELLAARQRFHEKPDRKMMAEFHGNTVILVTNIDPTLSESKDGLIIQFPLTRPRQLLEAHASLLLASAAVILLAALAAAYLLSRSISRPLLNLTDAASAYGDGHLDRMAPVEGPLETRTLGQAFNHMANSLKEHIHNLETETQRREQLESELRVAAQVQRSLLPESGVYNEQTLQVLGWSQQAKEVGGDFYDYWKLGDNSIAVVVGDASGKGMPAALLAAKCLSLIQAHADETSPPNEVLQKTNASLCRQFKKDGHFVTAVFLIVDVPKSRMRISFAGHNPVLYCTSATEKPMASLSSAQGLPLGVSDPINFETITIDLASETTVLLYTDGVTEAFGPENKLYGLDRLNERFTRDRGCRYAIYSVKSNLTWICTAREAPRQTTPR